MVCIYDRDAYKHYEIKTEVRRAVKILYTRRKQELNDKEIPSRQLILPVPVVIKVMINKSHREKSKEPRAMYLLSPPLKNKRRRSGSNAKVKYDQQKTAGL